MLLAIQTSNRSCVRMCMRDLSAICNFSQPKGKFELRASARLRNDGLPSSSLTGSSGSSWGGGGVYILVTAGNFPTPQDLHQVEREAESL